MRSMRGCQAINAGPCAYLVLSLCQVDISQNLYLGFSYFLRDLVRLQYHVRPWMYQEEERKLPVSNQFNKQYIRKIIINIPEGYTVENLDSLNMNIVYEKEGNKDMGFISSYKVETNQLIIECEEYYNSVNYPVDEYPAFENVINAAADFNKLAIVLKKSK